MKINNKNRRIVSSKNKNLQQEAEIKNFYKVYNQPINNERLQMLKAFRLRREFKTQEEPQRAKKKLEHFLVVLLATLKAEKYRKIAGEMLYSLKS